MPHPPRSCDRLDDDHMTAEVHRRWGELDYVAKVKYEITSRITQSGG